MKQFGTFFIILLLLATGCGKKIEKAIARKIVKHATKGKVDLSNNGSSMKFKTDKGAIAFASDSSLEIPEGFPSDVFIINHSKIAMSQESPRGFMLSLITDDDPATVGTNYKKEMTQRGWTTKKSLNHEHQAVLMFEKNTHAANVIISSQHGKTNVALMVAIK